MRVLFYLYPALLSQGPQFNAGWSLLTARLMRGLVDTGTVKCRMVTARRFEPALADSVRGLSVGYVDDLMLQREMVLSDPFGAVPTEMSRRVRSAHPFQYPNVIRLIEHIRQASEAFMPDVVVTFGMQADYVKEVWPDATVFHVEATALSRNPYPFSLFFDHLGMYRNSAPARLTECKLSPQSAAAYDLLDEVRSRTAMALATNDPFKSFDFRHRFQRLVLMPLQVSNYYSFDEQANFRTQFEYLLQILSAAPQDVGVIVTEYIQWGEVLHDNGSGANLSWLRRSFPNLIFHEEFRSYDSASQFMLPHVDGLFTISSNLGYQALLHHKRLVCSPQSHLRSMSHHTSLTEFFAKITEGKTAAPRDEFLAWYLTHYAVPFELACDGAWLLDYLNRRLTAIGRTDHILEAFVPVAPTAVLRKQWLDHAQSHEPRKFETSRAAQCRAQAKLHVELARTTATASTTMQMFSSSAVEIGANNGAYLLLNDTRSIDGALHWGCNTVTAYIEKQMKRMGLSCAGRLNFKQDCTDLLGSDKLDQVRLAVFNGEGSVHHDSERVRDLMSFCRLLKERGVPCVLINSVWHENTRATAELLDAFSIITVRESVSLEAIMRWRPDARLVPDLTFSISYDLTNNQKALNDSERPCITVVDHVEATCAAKLFSFAKFHSLPFYLMGQLHVESLIGGIGSAYEAGGVVYPKILVHPPDLRASLGCLTGRYHGLVAALRNGVPAVALASNTPKIEGMLNDIGLGQSCLLDARWRNQGHLRQREIVEQRLRSWTFAMDSAVESYSRDATSLGEVLWQDIAALATSRQGSPRVSASTALKRYFGAKDPAIALGERRELDLSHHATLAAQGFHAPESWGMWSAELRSQVTLVVDEAASKGAVLTIRMDIAVFSGLLAKEPAIRISSCQRLIGYMFFRGSSITRQTVEFSIEVCGPLCRIDLEISDVMSPADAGLSQDGRQLGFALHGMSVACDPISTRRAIDPNASLDPRFLLWGIDAEPITAAVQ